MEDNALVADVAGCVTRFQAPGFLAPTRQRPHEELLQQFEAARQRTREFADGTAADLRQHFFKHPVFGDLDFYQWILLIAAHCDRHRAQSEEVMASAGYPRAALASAPA
jgi:DinB superfamily